MKRCPKCGNDTFIISVHVVQDWKVDANESYLETMDDYVETVYKPDDEDIWTCTKCSYDGPGYEFNVKEKE